MTANSRLSAMGFPGCGLHKPG